MNKTYDDAALEAIKRAYETTGYATEAIGKLFGCTGAYVRQMSIKHEWKRSVPVQRAESGDTDWSHAERLYRVNRYTNQEIADKVGCSEAQVRGRAKKYKWPRDRGEDINARAEAKVYQAQHDKKTGRKKTEDAIIELEAEVIARIITSERDSVTRMRSLTERLLNELEIITPYIASIEEINELKRLQQWTPTSSRLKMFSDLMANAKTLFELERRVHGIKDKEDDKPVQGVTLMLSPADVKL